MPKRSAGSATAEEARLLLRAIAIAVEAHAGQLDKAGRPYILHPLRVMLKGRTARGRMVRVMHDVLEDNPQWSADRLRDEGFPADVVRGVLAMTKQGEEIFQRGDSPSTKSERYGRFIVRCARDPLGAAAKIDDLDDNLDLLRLNEVSVADLERVNRYLAARQFLVGVLDSDSPRHSPHHVFSIMPRAALSR